MESLYIPPKGEELEMIKYDAFEKVKRKEITIYQFGHKLGTYELPANEANAYRKRLTEKIDDFLEDGLCVTLDLPDGGELHLAPQAVAALSVQITNPAPIATSFLSYAVSNAPPLYDPSTS